MRNPELKAAGAAIRVASMDVRAARNAVFPTLSVEANYGLEANAFKLHSTPAADPSVGPLPNLGYTLGFNLSIPVFNWGSTRSKVRQAEIREKQAGVELNRTQRELLGNLYTTYNEAVAARASVDLTRSGGDLAAESLRLTNLRYQAGEATVLEVVDAQDALLESRTAHDEAQVRYRIAVSSLQGLSGGF